MGEGVRWLRERARGAGWRLCAWARAGGRGRTWRQQGRQQLLRVHRLLLRPALHQLRRRRCALDRARRRDQTGLRQDVVWVDTRLAEQLAPHLATFGVAL